MDKIRDTLKELPYIGPLVEGKPKVIAIRMAGVIADGAMMRRAGISYAKYTKIIDKAFATPNLKAVALVINSPGGAPAQCSLITSQIRKLADEKEIPVFAFVEDVAASGGYWLACAAGEIYAQETSIVGSIGVISAGFGLEDFIKRYDIHRRVYTSGKDKSFLDPFKAERPEDVARLRELQESMHEAFKNWVKDRRGDKINGDDRQLMEGAFWTAPDALHYGLIDGLGDCRSVIKDRFGDDIKIIDVVPDKKWFASFPFGGEAATTNRDDMIAAALSYAEDRAAWSRFGL
jgi:signal peptide peptidase SppA